MRREQADTKKTKTKTGSVPGSREKRKPVKKLVTGTTEILDFDLEAEVQRKKKTEKTGTAAKKSHSSGRNRAAKRSKNATNTYGGNISGRPVSRSEDTKEFLDPEEIPARNDKKRSHKKDDSYMHFVPRKNVPASKRRAAGKSRTGKKKNGIFEDFSAMDVVIALTGVMVLFVAVVTIGVYSNANALSKQVEAMARVGEKMEEIGIAGEGIFTAVADAKVAGIEAAQLSAQEETPGEYGENALTMEVSVGLKLSSVQKDMKIKFTNKKNGKLISNQTFSVDVSGPENKSFTDEDRDGIIYIKSITPGEYSVTVTGPEEIDGNKVAGIKGIVTVKNQIEYKKIDVTDEVKKESEINAAKEDTVVVNQVESVLTDTIEWVESTKTAIEEGDVSYEEVKKGEIPDPSAAAALDMIWTADNRNGSYLSVDTVRLAENSAFYPARRVNILNKGVYFTETEVIPSTEAESTEPSESTPSTESPEQPDTKPSESVPPSEPSRPEVSGISVSVDTGRVEVGKSVTVRASVTMSDGSDYNGEIQWTAEGGQITGGGGSILLTDSKPETVTVKAKAEGKESSVTVEFFQPDKKVSSIKIPAGISIVTGGTAGLSLDIQPDDAKDKTVEWKVVKGTEYASVDGNGIVKGLKAGTAEIQAAAKDGGASSNICTVSVSADIGVSLEAPGSIKVGEVKQLKCSTAGELASLKWSVSDAKIATIDEGNGKVKAVAAGKVTVTVRVKGKNGKEASASGELTVNPANVDEIRLEPAGVTIRVGEKKTIKAAVSTKGSKGVTWNSGDEAIAKIVESRDDSCVVQGIKPGKFSIEAVSKENKDKTARCEVTVELKDGSARLKDKAGNLLYYKDGDRYKEATAADYYKYDVFYRKKDMTKYRYTGWQTIDGKRYYFDKNGNPVTGDQIIQGMKYTFNSDGSLQVNGIMGIDVSKHNGAIDWNAVKNSGVDFVIIRCGYRGSATGVLVEDQKFRANIQGAAAAGLKIGIYFFSQAVNEVEAVEEASMAASLINSYKITYPVFMDVESANGRADGIDAGTRTQVVNAFCRTIQNSGYTAGVYANKTWLGSKMNAGAFGGCKIWLAQYAAAPTYGGRYEMWQYSSKGKISGISGDVDLNISYMGY